MPKSLSGHLPPNNTRLQQNCADFVPILCRRPRSAPYAHRHRGMTEHERSDGITELVDALLEGYAPISVLLTHMLESPGNPTVEEVRGILGGLLCDVLKPLAGTFAERDLKTAAAIVEASVPLITDDFFLVPHSASRPNRAERRSRGGRRNGRRP
jgi:hypothetical protein